MISASHYVRTRVQAARVWLFDSDPVNTTLEALSRSLNESTITKELSSISPAPQDAQSSARLTAADATPFEAIHCIPDVPALGLLHAPLLESMLHSDRAAVTIGQHPARSRRLSLSEGDAIFARVCAPAHMGELCTTWEGMQLCVLLGSSSNLQADPGFTTQRRHAPRFRRQLRLFTLRASSCNATPVAHADARTPIGVCEVVSSDGSGANETQSTDSFGPCCDRMRSLL